MVSHCKSRSVAANDVQLEVIHVPCLDVNKCMSCIYGNSCNTEELSGVAASEAAVSLKHRASIRLFGEPAAALVQATEATSSDTWP